jgi:hypothetical protein
MALTGGTRFKVTMGEVFPAGCALVPGSITEAQDYDEATAIVAPRGGKSAPAAGGSAGKAAA